MLILHSMFAFLRRQARKLYSFMATGAFFGWTIGLFVFQSLWVALSATFPLPFDENFHVGIINLYSHQWSPFVSHQPASASLYGDVTRTPSYLYHYLMSFPYRLVELITDNFATQIIILRLMNIGLFVMGLFLFRRLLIKLGLSKRLSQAVLLCFIMVPIVPLLAAHSNYDNLLFVLVPACLLLAIDIIKVKKIEAGKILLFLSLSLLACLVKFTFVPIAAIAFLFVGHSLIKTHGKRLIVKILSSFSQLERTWKVGLVILTILSFGLVAERYVVNAVRYHSLQPDCIAIQPFDVCKHWSPWARDNIIYKERYKDWVSEGPVKFTKVWVPKMINDAFVAFTYSRVDPVSLYGELGPIRTKEGLSIIKAMFKIVFALGVLLILLNFGKLWKDKVWRMIFSMLVVTAILLWIKNYGDYRDLKHITAIQPRYMLILAPLAMAAIAQTFNRLIGNIKVKAILFGLICLVLIQGGGVTIYILRSYSAWYWPNEIVVRVNSRARDVLNHFIIVR